jgi:hypothetical protein
MAQLQTQLAELKALYELNKQQADLRNLTAQLQTQFAEIKDLQNLAAEQQIQLAELKAMFELVKPKSVCPTNFTYIPVRNGCYKLLARNLNWTSAGLGCRSLHNEAHLVIIDNRDEQDAIQNILSINYTVEMQRSCYARESGGIHVWTAGQRVNPSTQSEFVWKVLSANGRSVRASNMTYHNWGQGQPDSWRGRLEPCMNLVQHWQYKWNDDLCIDEACSLCEIDM